MHNSNEYSKLFGMNGVRVSHGWGECVVEVWVFDEPVWNSYATVKAFGKFVKQSEDMKFSGAKFAQMYFKLGTGEI